MTCRHQLATVPPATQPPPLGLKAHRLSLQRTTCANPPLAPLPPPTQRLMAGQPGRLGQRQQRQLLTRHTASPHTGVEGRSAGVEEWQQQPSHHTASIASPPCLVPHLPASSYSGAYSGLIRTAGPAADFLALYDCCMANGLKARLKFNHQAAHQEIVIS
jgi:hypothetical protein